MDLPQQILKRKLKKREMNKKAELKRKLEEVVNINKHFKTVKCNKHRNRIVYICFASRSFVSVIKLPNFLF